MALEWIARLGIGVVLAWATLPLLVKLARRSRDAQPAVYYRALLAALAIATMLLFMPLVRSASASVFSLLRPGSDVISSDSDVFVRELVGPLISSATNAWPALPWGSIFAAIGGSWLLLLATGLSSSLLGQLRLDRKYRGAASAPGRVLERATRIATELGLHTPPIRVADRNAAAFTYGAIAPVIVISASTCELGDDELDFVLRHELCHVARHDTRAIYLIDFAQRCFAGHPSLRPLASEIRVAREARADEAAAGSRSLEYARFLLTIAQHMESTRHGPYGSLISMADTALERRVDMLINSDRSHPRRSAPWLVLAGLGLCSLVFLAPNSIGQTQGNTSDHPTVRGNLTVEQVEQALFTKPQPMLSCYEGLTAPRSNLPVKLSFEIDERGRVSSGRVSVPDHPQLEPCLHAALMQRTFPRPTSGTVSVEAPTLLTPPYDERRAVLEAREGTSQSLSRDVIRTTMRGYFPQLRGCFERVDKTLRSVNVNMSFVIGRDGRTIDGSTIDKSEPAAEPVAFAQLAQCVDDVRRTMQFPVPEDGIVSVDYPITFGHEPVGQGGSE